MRKILRCTAQFFFISFGQKMKIHTVIACLLFLSVLWVGCKDPYDVRVQNSQQAVLVVEGFLNSGGVTSIKLSRSASLNDTASMMESGALVIVESANAQYPLAENTTGIYNADLGQLDPLQEYRLHINVGGKEYVSDYVKPQSTPPIDSISWVRDDKGVTIYATTHDPANASHYYKYDYEETWETHANYIARYMWDPVSQTVHELLPNEYVYQCWKTTSSSSINIATSTALQSDVIYQKPLVLIPNKDQKLSVRYSILVKQYVLSKQAYEFFQLMKKNTESLGTVFDPQPSQITGNIHAVGGNEPVIGFFYASSEQQKRIFINASEVPYWGFGYKCDFQKVPPNIDSVKVAINNGWYPYDADKAGIIILNYRVSDRVCFDCTINGGSTTKPIFW